MSEAFWPGFLVMAMVTAGARPLAGPARPGGAPCQTYCEGTSAAACTVATSDTRTGRPFSSPSTSCATSSRSARYRPAANCTMPVAPTRSPGRAALSATCNACDRPATVMPWAAMRAGSRVTSTARSGAPMVYTSRVPGTCLIAFSSVCAISPRSSAPRRGSSVHNETAITGTSSMPLGLTTTGPTGIPEGIQSVLE